MKFVVFLTIIALLSLGFVRSVSAPAELIATDNPDPSIDKAKVMVMEGVISVHMTARDMINTMIHAGIGSRREKEIVLLIGLRAEQKIADMQAQWNENHLNDKELARVRNRHQFIKMFERYQLSPSSPAYKLSADELAHEYTRITRMVLERNTPAAPH